MLYLRFVNRYISQTFGLMGMCCEAAGSFATEGIGQTQNELCEEVPKYQPYRPSEPSSNNKSLLTHS